MKVTIYRQDGTGSVQLSGIQKIFDVDGNLLHEDTGVTDLSFVHVDLGTVLAVHILDQ